MINSDKRTRQQIEHHYKIEQKLAERLLNSTKQERKELYSKLYDDLFRLVPEHPQLTRKKDQASKLLFVKKRLKIIKRFVKPNDTFMEIGAGDCSISLAVSHQVKQVYAIDVSEEIAGNQEFTPNFKLIITNGINIPLPDSSVDIAYSDQLMEHLHPDDAIEQLQNIYRTLVKGGKYICITPNFFNGPHDVSRYFDPVATGFHLKEYSVTGLSKLFKQVGFSDLKVYIGARGKYLEIPVIIVIFIESILSKIPFYWRRKVSSSLIFSVLLGIIIVGKK